jgi:hypothetical protein
MSVFALTFAAHYAWSSLSGAPAASSAASCAEGCGTSCSTPAAAGNSYIETQSYFLGYSFALSLAFASVAIRQYIEKRTMAAKGAAIGGLSLSTILGFAGCFLTGCCGSPMLAVYVSLLGTAFLPFAKPLVAVLTTLSIFGTAWWLNRSAKKGACCNSGTACEPTVVPVTIDKTKG